MKKIMFNDRYGLTQDALESRKTMTRRVIKNEVAIAHCEKCYIDLALNYAPYQAGEIVAIAQSYNNCLYDAHTEIEIDGKDYLMCETKGWDNKMYVKADLMLHHIRITNIRVERLQDISDEDCLREGITYNPSDGYSYFGNKGLPYFERRKAFAALIDKVSGKGTWERNPWVFVYEFELVD